MEQMYILKNSILFKKLQNFFQSLCVWECMQFVKGMKSIYVAMLTLQNWKIFVRINAFWAR